MASDSSCLMHVGGLLSRQRAGIRTMHLAEVLASTGRRPGRGDPVMSTEHATFLGMPPFPVAARAALADTQLRRNLAHATGTIRAKRAGGGGGGRRLGGAAAAGGRHQGRHPRAPRRAPADAGGGADRPWGDGALGARRRRRVRGGRRRGEGARHPRGREGQVDGDPGDRAQRGPCRAGDRGVGDRPGRADRAARRRPAQPHPGAGDPPQPLRDPRHLPREDGRRRAPGTRGADRRPGRAGVGRAAAPAREVPVDPDGGVGRELRCGGVGHAGGGGVRGQRADVPDPARGAGDGGRHREAGADLGRPRRVPAAAAALARRGSG